MILYKALGPRALKLMRAKIWKEYIDCDVVIAGHDGGFGPWGGWLTPLYLYPVYIVLLARVLGKPIVIYGASAPKIQRLRRLGKFLTRLVLNGADLITLREKTSAEYLKSIGVTNDKLSVTADPAFLLQPTPYKQVAEIINREGINTARALIGMTVTREIASKAFPDLDSKSSYRKHTEMLAQVVDYLTDKLNAVVIFVPHCLGLVKESDERDDRIIAKDILQICHNKEMVKVITNEYKPAELKGLIGRFDLFMGERLHSVINAMSMYVPSIAMSWPEDTRLDIIRMLGREDAVFSIQNSEAASLIAKVNDIWTKRDMIREQLTSQVKIIRERAMLNGKLLKELLDSR
jgi:polysaccharide pyruvyl transferase WcaK-like protein